MKNKIVVLIGLLSISGYSFSNDFKTRDSQDNVNLSDRFTYERRDEFRSHYNDPIRESRRETLTELSKPCKEIENISKRFSCSNKVIALWSDKYPDRGTKDFVLNKYKDMKIEDVRASRKALIQKMDQVAFNPKFGNEKIELTADMIEQELFYIEKYILKETPRKYFLRP